MKVCFSNKYGTFDYAKTGKGFFAIRLLAELEKIGVSTTTDQNERVDINLQNCHNAFFPKNAKKRITRCGPVHYDINMDWKNHNKEDRKYMKQCHGIVYQSKFSKRMNDAFLGPVKPEQKTAIIFNGADPEYYQKLKPYQSKFKFNYLASTREWVWEKRLGDIIESFIYADVPDSCLWVSGVVWDKPKRFPPFQKDFHKKYQQNNIRFLGPCDAITIGQLYRLCNAMIHIVYCDACPNAVVEALCAGCKVIGNNAGGQSELLQPLTDDVMRDVAVPLKPWNRRIQPKADMKWIADKIRGYACDWENSWAADCGHVNIRNIAKQYAEFFEEVLNG
jgi:glycosyltransferase involved in cell wall biosynthesis